MRVIAYIIDSIILGIAIALVAIILGAIAFGIAVNGGFVIGVIIAVVIAIIALLGSAVYFVYFWRTCAPRWARRCSASRPSTRPTARR